ncbi:hypothetical protein DPX16_16959 [Anabarilius grahami]|uniref:Uncharacterized protein n=1 Tax=Anabarilius grahami TaxID=495550 RepID=A0A3N0XCP6_ANAGA|nr:hypothetical protein DPX16_16959 [Anabarilius grahami]
MMTDGEMVEVLEEDEDVAKSWREMGGDWMADEGRLADDAGGGSGGGRPTRRGRNIKVQGGAGGVESQGEALNRAGQVVTQATARTVLHGGVAGGRSHGGWSPDGTIGMTGNVGGRAYCVAREPMKRRDTEDLGGRDGATATTP